MEVRLLTVAVLANILISIDARISCLYRDIRRDESLRHLVCFSTLRNNVLRRDVLFKSGDYTHITLKACQISFIDTDAFFDARKIWDLDLSENRIESLLLGVFDATTYLEDLDLSHNLLTELPVGIFDQTKLKNLKLKGNYVKTLESGLINIFTNMIMVDLSNNSLQIGSLDNDVFTDLAILNLSRNNITEVNLANVISLKYLFMKQCLLREIPKFLSTANLQKLLQLDLAENNIASIDNNTKFDSLYYLKAFNLSHNNIEYIHEQTFSKLRILESLDLSYNRLKTLPSGIFQNIGNLKEINLSHNLLRDISPRAFDGTTLKRLDFSNNEITYLHRFQLVIMLSAPLTLSFLEFGKIHGTLNDFVSSACLNDFLRELKDSNVMYNFESYDGERPVCVTTKEFTCKRQSKANDQFISMYKDISTR